MASDSEDLLGGLNLDELLDTSSDETVMRIAAHGWSPTERHHLTGVADLEYFHNGLRIHLDHEGLAHRLLLTLTMSSGAINGSR